MARGRRRAPWVNQTRGSTVITQAASTSPCTQTGTVGKTARPLVPSHASPATAKGVMIAVSSSSPTSGPASTVLRSSP